jgi:DNA (cytosine-5)-methyltransferase 1
MMIILKMKIKKYKKIKILNLYAGIGGNRGLWSGNIEVTNVEYNSKIANILKHFYPNDKIIIGDAHKYLLENYKEFDFIWSSPPCPSHSIIRKNTSLKMGSKELYPDMSLYQEIIFLMHHFKGKWVVENVISYYDPLIKPQEVNRHYFWSNFIISKIKKKDTIFGKNIENFNLDSNYNHVKVLRNMVNPKLGNHIFNCAFKNKQITLNELINN